LENKSRSLFARVSYLKWRLLNSLQYRTGTQGNVSDEWRADLEASELRAEEIDSSNVAAARQCIALARAEDYERIAAGDSLLRLVTKDGKTVSWGWRTQRDHFYISEVGLWINPRGSLVFYDYHTPPEHRGKGYHSLVMQFSFSTLKDGQKALVFALSDNAPPLKVYAKMKLTPIHPIQLLLTRSLTVGRRDRFG
jgi:hypothetical protein